MPVNDTTNWGWIIAGVAFVWGVINTVYTYYSHNSAVTKSEIDKLVAETAATTNRLTALERDMRALPSADTYHKLELKVEEVRGSMNTLTEKIVPIGRSVQRIDDFLMGQASTRKR